MTRRRVAPAAALLAGLALMLGGVAPPTAASINSQQGPREFIGAEQKGAAKARKKVKRAKRKAMPWQWAKSGQAIDGRGDYRSTKRLRRLALTRAAGVPNTGRQWVKLQKIIRRHRPDLLDMHPKDLAGLRITRTANMERAA